MSSTPDNPITHFAETNFRTRRQTFGIKQADRRSHMYVIGKTGTGKSTLLEALIRQDIAAGRGLALFDPHGDLADQVARSAAHKTRTGIINFDVPRDWRDLGFNPLADIPPAKRALAASGILEVFKKIWAEFWGPRTEHILRNALLTLVEQPFATLADILRLFDEDRYRKSAAGRVANAQVRHFWLHEYENYPKRLRGEAVAPLQNKVGAFLANPVLGRILTQPKSTLDLRQIMDEGQILIINLSKGQLGHDTTFLLGALLVSMISTVALGRADVTEAKRRDFHLYLDEFQSFTTESLAEMLSELRKYRVSLVLAHQFLSQLDRQMRDAILGNVGTTICFRTGAVDAELLEQEFYPVFRKSDLVALPNYHIYLKLMIDGVVSRPFSATTIPPQPARTTT